MYFKELAVVLLEYFFIPLFKLLIRISELVASLARVVIIATLFAVRAGGHVACTDEVVMLTAKGPDHRRSISRVTHAIECALLHEGHSGRL